MHEFPVRLPHTEIYTRVSKILVIWDATYFYWYVGPAATRHKSPANLHNVITLGTRKFISRTVSASNIAKLRSPLNKIKILFLNSKRLEATINAFRSLTAGSLRELESILSYMWSWAETDLRSCWSWHPPAHQPSNNHAPTLRQAHMDVQITKQKL